MSQNLQDNERLNNQGQLQQMNYSSKAFTTLIKNQIELEPHIEELEKYFDVETRLIKFGLGNSEGQDIQCYTLNIFNQYLHQNISFCEIDKQMFNQRDKYYAKLQPEADPMLVPKIIENILKPIKNHIQKYTEQGDNLDFLYDGTMELIKKLNAVKIE